MVATVSSQVLYQIGLLVTLVRFFFIGQELERVQLLYVTTCELHHHEV